MTLLEIHTCGYLFAIMGFTFSLLCRPGEVLDFWPRVIIFIMRPLPEGIRMKIYKIMWECEKCISGQIALWCCLLYLKCTISDTVLIICIAIFTSYFIAKIDAITRILWT